nr:endo-1,4-beta-xylanase 2-like [Nicotiana tomentosiformis]
MKIQEVKLLYIYNENDLDSHKVEAGLLAATLSLASESARATLSVRRYQTCKISQHRTRLVYNGIALFIEALHVQIFKPRSQQTHSQELKERIEKKPMIIAASSNSDFQMSKENAADTGNIILNHDFSDGLHFWRPNYGCDAFVVPAGSGYHNGLTTAIVSKRNQCWHGLEQDITSRISAGSTYTVSACVGASGTFQGCVNVLATLKLVYQKSETSFLSGGKKSVSNDGWGMLEGSFSLSTMPNEVIFYLEGPPPGAHLLIKSVVISCSSSTTCDESKDLMEKAPIITA